MSDDIASLAKPVSVTHERGAPRYDREQSDKNLIVRIHDTDHLQQRGRKMEAKINEVTEGVDKAVGAFSKAIERLVGAEKAIEDQTKKASGSLRDTTQKLGDAVAKLEKTANFDRLERYVALLERAASAMTLLAELEKSGKLDKIASALK